ncbi:hypothetical protein Y032_0335g2861 [Ancylostoma ceylanicum]|uniref:Uncharacterized protein n=1 Tax=Ancylostoma ceylanicum TaxID=53326 RepID=A0A016RYR8_9BILA|nr:hypothetical protein Y032_0335g2861 [Ancylostoma ceylanicum]
MVEQHPSGLCHTRLRVFHLHIVHVCSRVKFSLSSHHRNLPSSAHFSGNNVGQRVYNVGAVCAGCPAACEAGLCPVP